MSDIAGTTESTNPTTAETVSPWRDQTFSLAEFPEKLAIVKLSPGAEIPRWAESSSFFSVTATATETSLICAGRSVPAKTPSIQPLKAFRIVGELDPSAVGVLASLLIPAADLGIPVYTYSTFDTDWILVRVVDAETVAEAWRSNGHSVAAAVPAAPTKSQNAEESSKSGKAGKSAKKNAAKKGTN